MERKGPTVSAGSVGAGHPRGGLAVGLALLALVWSQFAWVRATNFGGFDEWLIFSLSSRGLVSLPYANRPLNLIWTVPGWWLSPNGLLGYHVLHVTYLALAGLALFWLVRRLLPRDPLLALLAGAFAACWAPSDMGRLTSVQMSMYSGFTLGMLLAAVVFVESWLRGSRALLALSVTLSWVMVRGYEATLPLLAVAALALWLAERGPQASRSLWVTAWAGGLALAAAAALVPMVLGSTEPTYQSEVWGGMNLDLGRILGRLARQYSFHLRPAITPGADMIASPAAALSGAAFLLGALLARRRLGEVEPERRSRLAALAAAGLALAGLGYSAVVLSAADVAATRMQFLSAPGIALFMAAAVRLLASLAPARLRDATALALAAWIAAVAGGRTDGMQRTWDRISAYPAQRGTLAQLTALAPDLEPGTLVVLLDESRSWVASFSFRHAVELLYESRATGCVWGAWDLLYPTAVRAEGVATLPWPSLQRSWGEGPTLHPFSALVIVRLDSQRRLSLVESWPAELPIPAAGTAYAPSHRIIPLVRQIPARALLLPPSLLR
jgi:hypothetical protein